MTWASIDIPLLVGFVELEELPSHVGSTFLVFDVVSSM
jgi:hypothetical protein